MSLAPTILYVILGLICAGLGTVVLLAIAKFLRILKGQNEGSKVDFVTIHLDNTISIRRKNVEGNIIEARGKKSNPWKPKFTAGKSVFTERKKKGLLAKLGLKRRRRFVLAVEDSPFCFELDPRDGFLDDHWSFSEARKFISKLIALASARQKPWSNIQVILLFGGFMAVVFMQLLILRRIGF